MCLLDRSVFPRNQQHCHGCETVWQHDQILNIYFKKKKQYEKNEGFPQTCSGFLAQKTKIQLIKQQKRYISHCMLKLYY